MKKYTVTLYYHTCASVDVMAENEKDAIEEAYNKVSNEDLLSGLTEDDDPDVSEILDINKNT